MKLSNKLVTGYHRWSISSIRKETEGLALANATSAGVQLLADGFNSRHQLKIEL